MTRAKANKLYRTFVKGLITEAGFLTYPEDASTDELNTVIRGKGSRSRRLGIDFEPDSTASNIIGIADTDVTSEYHWETVDNDASTNFLCLQIGSTVHFYDTDIEPISAGKKTFTIDLTDYKTDSALDAQVSSTRCQMANGKGFLFIVQEFIEPIVIEYDADTDTISTVPIIVQIRDFDGLDDSLANDEEPTTLTKEHYYNLRNQGWVKPGSTGVLQGAGTTNPNTPPAPPATSGTLGEYHPWTGLKRNYNEP